MASSPHIIISRTDRIGDVVLTLPVARYIRQHIPGARISFLGRSYTRAVIEACAYVDAFIEREDFLSRPHSADVIVHVFPDREVAAKAKEYGIARRIGTTNRLFHWSTCNKMVRLSRRNSALHESQLNLKLLRPLGISVRPSLEEIGSDTGLAPKVALQEEFRALLDPNRLNLIFHPCSQGSAREWGVDNFISLARLTDPRQVKLFVSGTAPDQPLLAPLLEALGDRVTDLSGRMDLPQLIAFIAQADGLVANSTGPLHLAGALGRYAFGIYPPIRPMHPGRWAPIGPHARAFVVARACSDCRKQPASCHCITEVLPMELSVAIHKMQIDGKKASSGHWLSFGFPG